MHTHRRGVIADRQRDGVIRRHGGVYPGGSNTILRVAAGMASSLAGDDADDEVFDLAVAPAGSHVLVWPSDGDLPVKGQVARTDEAGSTMLVVLEDRTERWVTSEQRWTLAELQPESAAPEQAPPPAPPRGEPLLPDDPPRGEPLLPDDTPIIRGFLS